MRLSLLLVLGVTFMVALQPTYSQDDSQAVSQGDAALKESDVMWAMGSDDKYGDKYKSSSSSASMVSSSSSTGSQSSSSRGTESSSSSSGTESSSSSSAAMSSSSTGSMSSSSTGQMSSTGKHPYPGHGHGHGGYNDECDEYGNNKHHGKKHYNNKDDCEEDYNQDECNDNMSDDCEDNKSEDCDESTQDDCQDDYKHGHKKHSNKHEEECDDSSNSNDEDCDDYKHGHKKHSNKQDECEDEYSRDDCDSSNESCDCEKDDSWLDDSCETDWSDECDEDWKKSWAYVSQCNAGGCNKCSTKYSSQGSSCSCTSSTKCESVFANCNDKSGCGSCGCNTNYEGNYLSCEGTSCDECCNKQCSSFMKTDLNKQVCRGFGYFHDPSYCAVVNTSQGTGGRKYPCAATSQSTSSGFIGFSGPIVFTKHQLKGKIVDALGVHLAGLVSQDDQDCGCQSNKHEEDCDDNSYGHGKKNKKHSNKHDEECDDESSNDEDCEEDNKHYNKKSNYGKKQSKKHSNKHDDEDCEEDSDDYDCDSYSCSKCHKRRCEKTRSYLPEAQFRLALYAQNVGCGCNSTLSNYETRAKKHISWDNEDEGDCCKDKYAQQWKLVAETDWLNTRSCLNEYALFDVDCDGEVALTADTIYRIALVVKSGSLAVYSKNNTYGPYAEVSEFQTWREFDCDKYSKMPSTYRVPQESNYLALEVVLCHGTEQKHTHVVEKKPVKKHNKKDDYCEEDKKSDDCDDNTQVDDCDDNKQEDCEDDSMHGNKKHSSSKGNKHDEDCDDNTADDCDDNKQADDCEEESSNADDCEDDNKHSNKKHSNKHSNKNDEDCDDESTNEEDCDDDSSDYQHHKKSSKSKKRSNRD